MGDFLKRCKWALQDVLIGNVQITVPVFWNVNKFLILFKFACHATNGAAILGSSIVCRRHLNFPQTQTRLTTMIAPSSACMSMHVNRKLLVTVDIFLSRMIFHTCGWAAEKDARAGGGVGGCKWFWHHHRPPSHSLSVPQHWQVLYCSSLAWVPKVPMC